jgi:hypothetical protein
MFDNSVHTTLEEALSAFVVIVEASQSVDQRFTPRITNQTGGVYDVSFYTPKLPQDIMISVKHASGKIIESSRAGAEVDTPLTVETITIKTVELDNKRTRIVCPTVIAEAGTTVSCLLTLFNKAGDPVTEPSMAAVLHGQTFLAGTKPSTRITHRFNNEFIVTFTPTEIPSPNGRATATLNVRKLEAGGLTSAVGEPQKIACASAAPKPERSRVVRCVAGTAGVSATVQCEISTFDNFGSPAGTPIIARGLRFEARLLGTATSFKSEVSVPLDVDTPGAFNNRFELSAMITQAGIWDVTVYHDNIIVQGSESSVHRVTVLPGPAAASQSTLNCANKIICGGLATCVLGARDRYGNPTVFVPGDVRNFYHEFRPSQVIRTSTAKVSIDLSTNVTTLTFRAPDKERGDISVTSSFKGTLLGMANNISSSPRSLSPTKSSVHCSRDRAGYKDGDGPALVAGQSVNCVLTAISGEDEKTEVNDAAMVHAFHVTVSDNGRQTVLPTTEIKPVGRGGQFTFKITVERAGTMSVLAEYEKSGVRIRLRGNTKNYPDAQHDLAGAVENKVIGGKIYPLATKTSCFADASLGVLDDVICIYETYDEYLNIVGGTEDASVYPEVSEVSPTGTPLYAVKEPGSDVGVFRTRLKIRRAGQWNIALIVQRQTVATVTVNLVPGPLAPEAGFSSLDCSPDAPAGTRVSCELLAFDAYGNAALTSAATGRALSLSIRPPLAEGYQDMIQPSTRKIGIYVVSFKTPQLSTRISVSLSAPLSIEGNSSSAAGVYVSVGTTAQIAVRGTVLHSTSKLECSPLKVTAGGTVSCMIFASEMSTGQPTSEALKDAFSWIHATSDTEIVRSEFISAVRFVTAGVYAFDVIPRVVTSSGDDENTGRATSGLRVSAVYYNGGPESYMQLGSENEIEVVAGPISAAQSDVECDQIVRLPAMITCRVLVFDAFNNPVGSASFVEAFSATSVHAMLGLSHRSSAANTTVSFRENRGLNLAEYSLSIPVTTASEGTNHLWETVVSFGSEVVGKLGTGRGSLHSTNVLSGPLSPKDCQLLCQKDTPAMVPVVCLLQIYDEFQNPVDAESGLILENVDTVFEHPDEDILRDLLPNVALAPTDFDESRVGGNTQYGAADLGFTNNRLLVTFTAPPTKTSLGVMLRLLSRSAADPPVPFDSGRSLTVNVTQAIALSTDYSSLECKVSIDLVTEAGAPIICTISAVSESGDYIGTSALSDAFAVSAFSSSGEEVFVTPVKYSGFFGDFVFQVRPEVSTGTLSTAFTGTAGRLTIQATYNTGEDDPVMITSPDAGTSFDTTRLTVVPAAPSQASLECDDAVAVGGAVCIAKTNDAYGNPSGSMRMAPLIYVEARLGDDAGRGLVFGSELAQWEAEGEFQVSIPMLRKAGTWHAKLDTRFIFFMSNNVRVDEMSATSSEQQITILPGPWDPTRADFSCPKNALTNTRIICSLSLEDADANPVRATLAHSARILVQVEGMPADAPVLSGVSLPTDAGSSTTSISVIVGAPASPTNGLQIFLFDAQTWTAVGRPAVVDVSRTKLSTANTKTRCRGENIDGSLPQAGTPVFCEVWPIDENNEPITDTAFAESLSIWTSQRGVSQTAFQQKERGQFWATFTPTRAMNIRVRLLLTEQISGRDKVTVLNGGVDRKISVSVRAGMPDLAKSRLRCANSVRAGTSVSAGDNIDCVMSLVDGFFNKITDKQISRDLSLRVLTAGSGLLVSSGRVDFEYVRRNEFRSTVPVTQAGNLVFRVTSTISSGGDFKQAELIVGPGTASAAASKFLCPARLERLGLDKFSCFVFLFDSYGNPLAHPLTTPATFSSKSTRRYGRQVHVNFEAGADKRTTSYRVKYSPVESDDLLSTYNSVRAQFVVELSTDPTSKTSLNATELVLSAHIHNEIIGGAGSVARPSIVATSEETLNAYSAIIKYKFNDRSLVVGKRVRATMYIRKTDSKGVLKTVKMPSLAALLVGSVQNRQALSPPMSIRAISNRFEISFTPTASGPLRFSIFLTLPSSKREIIGPKTLNIRSGKIDRRRCTVRMPTILEAGKTDSHSVLIEAKDEYGNIVEREEDAGSLHGSISVREGAPTTAKNAVSLKKFLANLVLGARFDPILRQYVLRLPGIIAASMLDINVGIGSIRNALQTPFSRSALDVLPALPSPVKSTLTCPVDAAVEASILCLLTVRDIHENLVQADDSLLSKVTVSAYNSFDSSDPKRREFAAPKIVLARPSDDGVHQLQVSFSFSNPGNATITTNLGRAQVSEARIPIYKIPIDVTKSLVRCPFFEVEAGSPVACMVYLKNPSGDPTGQQSDTTLIHARIASGGVDVDDRLVSISFLTKGSFLINFAATRVGSLNLEVRVLGEGTIGQENMSPDPNLISVLPGKEPDPKQSKVICTANSAGSPDDDNTDTTVSSSDATTGSGSGQENAAAEPRQANGDRDASSPESGSSAGSTTFSVSAGSAFESCKLVLYDAFNNLWTPDAQDADAVASAVTAIEISLSSDAVAYAGTSSFLQASNAFALSVSPETQGTYEFVVSFNKLSVSSSSSVQVLVSPGDPDMEASRLECPFEAVEESARVECSLHLSDKFGNPANSRICAGDLLAVSSVPQTQKQYPSNAQIEIDFSGNPLCCNKGAQVTIESCPILAVLKLPPAEEAGNGTQFVLRTGISSDFQTKSISTSLNVIGDSFIFGGARGSDGSRRRVLLQRARSLSGDDSDSANMEVICPPVSSSVYIAGDSITCKTIVSLPKRAASKPPMTQQESADVVKLVEQELVNFRVQATNAGSQIVSIPTTLAPSDVGSTDFEFSHTFTVERAGPTSLSVFYRGKLLLKNPPGNGDGSADVGLILPGPADSTTSILECPSTPVTAGEDIVCRVVLLDTYENVLMGGNDVAFPSVESFSVSAELKSSGGAAPIQGSVSMESGVTGASTGMILARISGVTVAGAYDISLYYGTLIIGAGTSVAVVAGQVSLNASSVTVPTDIVTHANWKVPLVLRDLFGNEATAGVLDTLSATAMFSGAGAGTGMGEDIYPMHIVKNAKDGTFCLEGVSQSSGNLTFEVVGTTKPNEGYGDALASSVSMSATVVSHALTSDPERTQIACAHDTVAGSLVSCQIMLYNAANSPLDGGKSFEKDAVHVDVSVAGVTSSEDVEHFGGNVFTASFRPEISDSEGQINVIVSARDPRRNDVRGLLSGARRRRLSGNSFSTGIVVRSGRINAASSLVWCQRRKRVTSSSGVVITCWVEARDSAGNLAGSTDNVGAFKGMLTGSGENPNRVALNGGTPLATQHATISFSSDYGLFVITFPAVSISDRYVADITYSDESVGVEQQKQTLGVAATGHQFVDVLPAAPISLNLSCPTRVITGANYECIAFAVDAHGNGVPATEYSVQDFLRLNATFQAENSLHKLEMNVTVSGDRVKITAPTAHAMAETSGSYRIAYFKTDTKTAAMRVVHSVVPLHLNRSRSILECSSVSSSGGAALVAGTLISCTVTLQNSTGGTIETHAPTATSAQGATEMAALSVIARNTEAVGGVGGSSNSSGSDAAILFYTSMVSPGVYEASSSSLTAIGTYNISAMFAGAQLGAGSLSVSIVAAAPRGSQAKLTCPSTFSIAGEAVSCDIAITDAFGNKAGSASQAPLFQPSVVDSQGLPVIAAVTFGDDAGSFALNTQLNRSGDSTLTLRFDGSISVQGYSRNVIPSVPIRLVNVTCPGTVVVLAGGTGRLDCTFVAVDAFGNSVLHADIDAVRALALESGRIQASSNGKLLPAEVVADATSFAPHSSSSTSIFVLRFTPRDTGQVTFTSDASLGLELSPVTVAASTADLSKTAISCTQTIFAGDSVACSIVLRNDGDGLVGGAESLSAFALSSTSDGTPRIQFKSTGMFIATIPAISSSGAYVMRANFSGFPINVDAANVTTIVSAADVVDPARSTIACPEVVSPGHPLLCTIVLRDPYGNKHSKASRASSVHTRVVLSDGTSLTSTLPVTYDGAVEGFLFNTTLPLAGEGSSVRIGDSLEVHTFVSNVRISSGSGEQGVRPTDANAQATAISVGAPVPSTSVAIVVETKDSGPICVSLQQLVDSCVAQRGEWGFTCSSMRSWKRSGGCAEGQFMTPQGCQVRCPE